MDAEDVESETILSSIFRDAFQESYQDNPEFLQYLSELSSYGIARLNSEPSRLAEEKAQILEETRSLAFHNYKTFIQTADCCKEIFNDFQIIEKHVDSVLQKLPNLTSQCKTFMKEAQDINACRKVNNQTLLKHSQLLEILELPQLVDTCVRNEYYEETLELAEYVKRLEKKHSNIPMIQKIVEEVKMNMQVMLMQLLQQLRTNIQLPVCLRVLGYLRRMNVLTETELRIKFLQARDTWFQTVLQSIPREDPYHHISKTIEASRVHLFDIITQYRAIFSDDDVIFVTSRDPRVNDAALFHSWVLQKIFQFLSTLEEDLNRGVGNRLDSLFGQCMYFGLSFGRVGSDFRSLVTPIFCRVVLSSFVSAVESAGGKLGEALLSYTLLGTQPSMPSSVINIQSAGSTFQPPMSLLEFPPLASYCNDILSAFNDLRLCAPFTLACDVTECLSSSLVQAVEFIVMFHRLDETTFNSQETDKFISMCRCFSMDLLPHIHKCLQSLFPQLQINSLMSVSILEHAKEAKLGELDVERIVEPLKRFIPLQHEIDVKLNKFSEQERHLDASKKTEVIESIAEVAESVTEVSENVAEAAENVTDIINYAENVTGLKEDSLNVTEAVSSVENDSDLHVSEIQEHRSESKTVKEDSGISMILQSDMSSSSTEITKDIRDIGAVSEGIKVTEILKE